MNFEQKLYTQLESGKTQKTAILFQRRCIFLIWGLFASDAMRALPQKMNRPRKFPNEDPTPSPDCTQKENKITIRRLAQVERWNF